MMNVTFCTLPRFWRTRYRGVGCVIRVVQLPVHRSQVSVCLNLLFDEDVFGMMTISVLCSQILQRGVTRRDRPAVQAWSQVSECCPSPWGRSPCFLYIWICLLCQARLYFWRFEYLSWFILLYSSMCHIHVKERVFSSTPYSPAGQMVYTVRQRCGRQLAIESPTDADVVSTVPESATPAALGYAQQVCVWINHLILGPHPGASLRYSASSCPPQSGLPYIEVLCKNRYVGRTFIQPNTRLRQLGVAKKFGALSDNFAGKRVVLIDDSIVRGNTISPIIKLLKEAGATEVCWLLWPSDRRASKPWLIRGLL